MNIKKIVIKNFRSIGDEEVEISEPSKINLLIGRNNSGKSNVLRFLNLLGNEKVAKAMSSVSIRDKQGINPGLVIDDHRDYQQIYQFSFQSF